MFAVGFAAVVSVSFYFTFGKIFFSSIKDTATTTATVELVIKTIIGSLLTSKNVLLAKTISPVNFYRPVSVQHCNILPNSHGSFSLDALLCSLYFVYTVNFEYI